jgi:hypothetical protein
MDLRGYRAGHRHAPANSHAPGQNSQARIAPARDGFKITEKPGFCESPVAHVDRCNCLATAGFGQGSGLSFHCTHEEHKPGGLSYNAFST